MEHRPFISVIIPVWNGARYLDACLNSILRQSWQHFEVIIVDDGSRDATWNMLMHWKKQDARIIPFHQENAGVSEARNTAMRHASGDYYRFVDVDDQLPPDSLEQLVRCAEKNQSDLVLAAYTEVLGTTRTVRDLGKCTDTVESAEFLRRLERLSNSFYYGVLWNKIFRGDIIRQHDLRFTSGLHWGEDFVFVMQYLEHAERMSYITTPVYDYFRNPNGAVVRQLVNCFTARAVCTTSTSASSGATSSDLRCGIDIDFGIKIEFCGEKFRNGNKVGALYCCCGQIQQQIAPKVAAPKGSRGRSRTSSVSIAPLSRPQARFPLQPKSTSSL